MQIFLCHYVPKDSAGDLLWGFDWREALLSLENHVAHVDELRRLPPDFVDSRLVDRKTGKDLGETKNYCINSHCFHEDCGPTYLLIKTSD